VLAASCSDICRLQLGVSENDVANDSIDRSTPMATSAASAWFAFILDYFRRHLMRLLLLLLLLLMMMMMSPSRAVVTVIRFAFYLQENTLVAVAAETQVLIVAVMNRGENSKNADDLSIGCFYIHAILSLSLLLLIIIIIIIIITLGIMFLLLLLLLLLLFFFFLIALGTKRTQ